MRSHDVFNLFYAMLAILTGCQVAFMILLRRAVLLVPKEVARRRGLWRMFFGDNLEGMTTADAEAVKAFRHRVRLAVAVLGAGIATAVVWYTVFVLLNAAERRELNRVTMGEGAEGSNRVTILARQEATVGMK